MDTKFTTWSPAIYAKIHACLAEHVKSGMKILDLGPYEGNLEEYMDGFGFPLNIDAVEIDGIALNVLKEKKFQNITVNCIKADANTFIPAYKKQVDLVLSSASIHELCDPSDQRMYLNRFFGQLDRILKPGGKAIIADLYFPFWLENDEVDAFRQWQWETIHHASTRLEFVFPEKIDEAASRKGFRLISKEEIRAVEEIDRRYYVLVFQKPV